MSRDSRRVQRRWTLVRFIRGIQHQLPAIQLEPRPIAVVPRLGRSVDRKSQHVAIEADRCRHVENLNQRTNPVNVHSSKILRIWLDNISEDLSLDPLDALGRLP